MPVTLPDTAPGQSVYAVHVKYAMEARSYRSILHYQQDSGDTDVADSGQFAVQMMNAVYSVWQSVIMPTVSDQLSMVGIDTYRYWQSSSGGLVPNKKPWSLFNPYELFHDITNAYPVVGAITTDHLPNFNSYCLQKRTRLPGRRWRGSLHVPGICEAATLKDQLTSTELNYWRTNVDPQIKNIVTYLDGWGLPVNGLPVVWSVRQFRFATNAGGAMAGNYTERVINTVTNSLVGTMRHRKLKL